MQRLFHMGNLQILSLAVMLLFSGCTSTTPQEQNLTGQNQLCFPSACFTYETANTPEEQEKGLMYRESLPEMQGMLFPFKNPYIATFWMKNMMISLDIIWLDSELKIVDISTGIPPCTSEPCAIYSPSMPVSYAFEVNAGTAEKYSLSKGMKGTFTQ